MSNGPEHQAETTDTLLQSRRRMLQLGAIGATALVTIRPAMAQSAASISNCTIPVPDPRQGGKHIAADGSLVAPGTKGAFAPAGRPFTGEEVRRALNGGSLPGAPYDAGQAYINYIRKLQNGQSGFTCFASIQMRRH